MFADDPIMASAALDRLLLNVINIKGDSYRLKEKRQAGQAYLIENVQPGGDT